MLRGDFPKTEQTKKALRIYLLCAIKEKFRVKRRTHAIMEEVLSVCRTSGFEGFIHSQPFVMSEIGRLSFISYIKNIEYLQNQYSQ